MRVIEKGFRRAAMPSAGSRVGRSGQPKIRRAVLESLEPRQLLSTDLVTNLNDSGAGSLRQTLASAAPGDTIQFASSLSGGTINLSSGQLSVTQSVSIIGLGAGNLTISGGGDLTVFNIASATNVSISALTITSGSAGSRGNGGDIYNNGTLALSSVTVSSGGGEIGAGMYNNGGVVTITGSTFSNNTAEQQGGAILNASGGTINVSSSSFTSNKASGEAGGAICNENASATLTGSTLTSNTASTYGGAVCNFSGGVLVLSGDILTSNVADFWGGALFNYYGATISITNSTINTNTAYGTFGGALFNDQGTANISGSTFASDNIDDFGLGVGGAISSLLGTLNVSTSTFNGDGGVFVVGGGAIYADDISTTISNCTLTSNQAEYGAGVYQDSNDNMVVSGTTFTDNIASNDTGAVNYGGAFYNSGNAYVYNTTVTANEAEYGGGIFCFGDLTLTNCTVSTNSGTASSNAGGGIYVDNGETGYAGNTTLYNTIVAQNTLSNKTTQSDITGTLDVNDSKTKSSYNLIGTGGSGGLVNNKRGNKITSSPDLGSLASNGGPTQTMALQSGSPAIDAGSNALAVDNNGNALTTDQRGTGYPRIYNGTVDIGAYEVEQTSSVASVVGGGASSPLMPSAKLAPAPGIPGGGEAVPGFVTAVSPASGAYVPVEIRDAYGVEDIFFNGATGTGAGQTIAIIDAYNDPDIITDANTFSSDYGLPTFNSGGPTLQVLSETGTTSLPPNSSAGTWDVEESLDVEWAHAIAPGANIILFEATTASNSDLDTAVDTAADTGGVSVVSMSYLSYETLDYVVGGSETSTDSTYLTPAGHQGVTFLAAAGDQGAPALGYPAVSPNVVGVGGTSLLVGTDNSYLAESAWSGGGGGLSIEESQPSYQVGKVNGVSNYVRASPDVSMDADPETGVLVIDSYDGGSFQVGGTSLATPLWAGLIAIADQGLALRGQSSLNGLTQTLPMLYALPSGDFHDITTGDNGFPAVTGYDLATGLGTPIANLLVPALAGYSGTAVWTGLQNNNWFDAQNWNTFSIPNANTNVIINSGNPTAGAPIDIAGLAINGGTLQLAAGTGFSTITSLSISGNGTIDMTNNGLYIDFGSASDPITTIAGYLKSGYNSGAWTGTGIDSSSAAVNPSYALGYADGIDGVVSGLITGQIEIAYTLYGDANLDFSVNGADFTILSGNFNDYVLGWDKGDFNYSNTVNGEDFTLMSGNFNQNASQSAAEQPQTVASNGASTSSTSSVVTTVLTPPAPATQSPAPAATQSTRHTTPRHHSKPKHS
jgi:hypothetical protein